MKKIINTLVVLTLLLTTTATLATPENEEIDRWMKERNATSSEWSYKSVARAYDVGLMDNTNMWKNADFTRYIDRFDFIELTMNYVRMSLTEHKLNQLKFRISEFKDVHSSEIDLAYEIGIVEGVDDGVFAPQGLLTREQATTILGRVETLIRGSDSGVRIKPELEIFKDKEDISIWATQGVADLVNVGAVQGNEHKEFKPQGLCKREEVVHILFGLIVKRNLN